MDPQVPPPASAQPVRAQIVPEGQPGPLRVVLEEPRRFGKFGRWLLWTVLLFSIVMNLSMWGSFQEYAQPDHVQERYFSHDHVAANKVAIITVEGTIMSGEGFVKKQIDQVRRDKNVKAVVLRVDSPGGTVTGSDFIYHHLREMTADRKIPLVVSMGSMAASGGYYVSMAAGPQPKTIFAEPTCWTGSIGVIIPHYDVAGLLAKWDVQDDSIASHPLKQMGSPTAKLPEPYREEERKILKELVDSTFDRFKQIVLDNRPALKDDAASQEEVFTGRIFTAGEAQRHHLVDRLGFVEDAVDRAIELAGLDADHVRVVKYHKPSGLLEQVMGASQSRSAQFDIAALLDLSAPKAYYLCTLLPGLLRGE